MLSNLPVKTGRFDNTFRNFIISNLIGQFNLVIVEIYKHTSNPWETTKLLYDHAMVVTLFITYV